MLASNIAIVIGPTPPGTGVILPATAAAESNSTSPTSPASVLFMPTSITVAPGLIQSPLTISGRPTAAIKTSARPADGGEVAGPGVADGHGRVRVDEEAGHRPADEDRAADHDRLGPGELDPRSVEDLDHAGGRAGDQPGDRFPRVEVDGLPYADPTLCEQARVHGCQSVDVLARRYLRQHDGLIDVVGKRHLNEDAVHLGVAIELGDERNELGLGNVGRGVRGGSSGSGLLTGPALVADVDVGGRVVADEDRRQTGRPLAGRDPRFDDVLDPPAERGGDRLAVENLALMSRGALDRSVVGHQLAVAAGALEAHDDHVAGLDGGHHALAERCVDDVVATVSSIAELSLEPAFSSFAPSIPKLPENPPEPLPSAPAAAPPGTDHRGRMAFDEMRRDLAQETRRDPAP